MEDLRKCNSTHSCVGHRNAFPSLHEDGLLLSSAHLAAQAVLEAFMRLHGTPGSGTTKLGHHHAYQGNLQDVLVNTYSAQSVCICSGLIARTSLQVVIAKQVLQLLHMHTGMCPQATHFAGGLN